MRTYQVRVFVPQTSFIEAEDDADVLEKIGQFYKEIYQKDFRDWIAPLPQPEDEQ